MDEEIANWFEQEYRNFEARFLARERFWWLSAAGLEGTPLAELFAKFQETFPDHPSDNNTVLYLSESVAVTPIQSSIWLWCSHFEHADIADLRLLVSFMEDAERMLGTAKECSWIEMLDNFREEIVLHFYEPQPAIVELLKARGVRGGVD